MRYSKPKTLARRICLATILPFFALLAVICGGQAQAQSLTQTIPLKAGWNAVFLDVEPQERDLARAFAGTPVQVVTTFFPQSHPAPYLRKPGDAPWREEGWATWYAPARPDAVVTSLHNLGGYRAYLIESAANYTWNVTGRAKIKPMHWRPNTYNFLGFSVDPQAPPTFEKFFASSPAHHQQKIYRLVDGAWAPVRDLARERMASGEAYWIYCAGGSDYQGPVHVRVTGEGLNLGSVVRDGRVELANASLEAQHLIIESVSGASSLPLAYVDQDLSSLQATFPTLPPRLALPQIEPGMSHFLRLAARREEMTASSQSTLLRISNGEGFQVWLPVTAER
jgi:hypothetical protein